MKMHFQISLAKCERYLSNVWLSEKEKVVEVHDSLCFFFLIFQH